jgi:hypothetical protein
VEETYELVLYDVAFFGSVDMEAAVDSMENIRRFRAVVQHLNLNFSDRMHSMGGKYRILSHKEQETAEKKKKEAKAKKEEKDKEEGQEKPEDQEKAEKKKAPGWKTLSAKKIGKCPINLTRDEAIEWVHRTLERSRGLELPGSFNPLIVSQLFWEQSTPWTDLAHTHIESVANKSKDFVDIVLDECAPADIRTRLAGYCVEEALEQALKAVKEELSRILADKERNLMTYNHYFTSKIQDQRKSKLAQVLSSVAKAASMSWTMEDDRNRVETYIDPEKLDAEMYSGIEQNMAKFSAEDALDTQIAYYADELKYFINCVSKQVIERHLVDTLIWNVLSPSIIAGLTVHLMACMQRGRYRRIVRQDPINGITTDKALFVRIFYIVAYTVLIPSSSLSRSTQA